MAKFDPFLSLDCAPTPSTLAQSKERKGSNFAIWQPWLQERREQERRREVRPHRDEGGPEDAEEGRQPGAVRAHAAEEEEGAARPREAAGRAIQ